MGVRHSRRRRWFIALGILVGLVMIPVLAHLATHGRTPSIRDDKGEASANGVASLEWFELGHQPQAVLIRGRDARRPMLLMLHGGPGMPQMYLAHSFQAPLEEKFVVVQW